jgi:hypothetical protein
LDEAGDGFEDPAIDLLLRFTRSLELALSDDQGMIAALDEMQRVRHFHRGAHLLEQVERTERVARSLHKENRRA